MTRAEAIKILERRTTIPGDGYTFEQINEALDLALSALRGPTREQVERMRGHWVGPEGEEVKTDKYGCPIGSASCSVCDDYLSASGEYSCRGHFCPACGAPMTDEAVEMVMERLEELKDGSETD